MTPQQTTVYVPVSIEKDGLPTESGWYGVIYGADLKTYLWYDANLKIFMHPKVYDDTLITHYYKPTTGYFLTQEEMEEVKQEAREQAIREAAEMFVINPGSFGEGEYKLPFIEQESISNLLNKQP